MDAVFRPVHTAEPMQEVQEEGNDMEVTAAAADDDEDIVRHKPFNLIHRWSCLLCSGGGRL
jgi:hypothetical protein